MKHTEATLKSAFMKIARERLPRYVLTRYEDKLTSGIPDLSADGNALTSWWEFKLANPDFKSTGIQELTMVRKAEAAHYAAYIIYDVVGNRTLIVNPKLLAQWRTDPEQMTNGIDHGWVVDFIRRVHEG